MGASKACESRPHNPGGQKGPRQRQRLGGMEKSWVLETNTEAVQWMQPGPGARGGAWLKVPLALCGGGRHKLPTRIICLVKVPGHKGGRAQERPDPSQQGSSYRGAGG